MTDVTTPLVAEIVRPPLATISVRRAAEIHAADWGWCQASWHFTHNDYHDSEQMGIGRLHVFNHDRMVVGGAWPLHPHVEIEGISYVLAGSFGHVDSLGNEWVLSAGAILRMSFGAGALHAESNRSPTERLHFIKMWIEPDCRNLPISVEHRQYRDEDRHNRWLQVLRPVSAAGEAIEVHQQARVLAARIDAGQTLERIVAPGWIGYLYVPWGEVELNGEPLGEGDAAKILTDGLLALRARATSELVLVESAR